MHFYILLFYGGSKVWVKVYHLPPIIFVINNECFFEHVCYPSGSDDSKIVFYVDTFKILLFFVLFLKATNNNKHKILQENQKIHNFQGFSRIIALLIIFIYVIKGFGISILIIISIFSLGLKG